MTFHDSTIGATQPLQLSESRRVALARKLTRNLIRLNPGLGEAAQHQADLLADCALSPTQALMVIEAIYSPTVTAGHGQSTKTKWMVQALRERYADRLEKIASNSALFLGFLADLEEVVEERERVNSTDISFSFHEMFLCDEIGLCADEINRILSTQDCKPITAKKRLMTAVELVKAGHCATVEGALCQAGDEFGYE
jgi:hypothetical protein